MGYNNTSTTVLCLENLTIKSVRTADVLDCEFLEKEEMKRLGIGGSTSITADIVFSKEYTPLRNFEDKSAINIPQESEIHHNTISEGVTFSEGVSQLELEDLLSSDSTDVPVEVEGDTQDPEVMTDSLSLTDDINLVEISNSGIDQNFNSVSNKRIINYREDDIEWHPSFGRRFAQQKMIKVGQKTRLLAQTEQAGSCTLVMNHSKF